MITFYIHAYITVPTPAAIVTTVKIKKIHKGRFGTESVASIPKIAGGAGSVTSLQPGDHQKGRAHPQMSRRQDPAHGTAVISDGTRASAEVIRTCVGRK